MGLMGSPARWRTMPWMVTFFGILVIPLRRLKTTHALISQGGKGQTIAASTSSNGMAVTTK
jgi:hypothetical protein